MRLLAQNAALRSSIHLSSVRCLTTTASQWRFEGPKKKKGSAFVADALRPRLLAAKKRSSSLRRRMDDKHHTLQQRADSISEGHTPQARLRLDRSTKYFGRYKDFRQAIFAQLETIMNTHEPAALGAVSRNELHEHAALFMERIDEAVALADRGHTRREKNRLFWQLRDAFIQKDIRGLTSAIRYSLEAFIGDKKISQELKESQRRLIDFRFPHEWFPATRKMQRTIHVHVGPTNSGKTYNALKALENSKRGVYAGPLRLLATEVYQRLNAKGLPCALITGEEVRIPEETDQFFSSCTVEMMPLNSEFDVAVIDEIQMIADRERGSAWTSAVLGVQAKEVHVCGEERAVKIVRQLCASVGDKCVVHRYERLNPLKTMNKAIDKDYRNLRKGDCIVAFSRLNLHALKKRIEEQTGRRCAIIYGSLPPEVRVQQAALFNDPDNDYDFIVASDAIGMGLNLEIRRVVMDTVTKFDGTTHRQLTHPEIKQIGGRAGRYRSAAGAGDEDSEESKIGYVTTMERADLRSLQRAFTQRVQDLETACIHPPAGIVEKYASYYPPQTSLSYILQSIKMQATVSPLYTLDIGGDNLEIADIIQDLPLTIHDRLTFCFLPASLRAEHAVDVLRALAGIVATNATGDLLDIPEIPLEYLDLDVADFQDGQHYLQKLESLHVAINQYVWLSYRYAGMFRSQALAFHVRSLVEEKLINTLDKLHFSEERLELRRKFQRKRAKSHKKSKLNIGEEGEGEGEGEGERARDRETDLVLADVLGLKYVMADYVMAESK